MQRMVLVVLLAQAFVFCLDFVSAQELRYQLKQDQKISFEYNIQVDTSSDIISYTGMVNYHVLSVNNEIAKVNFQGGLNETLKPNPNRAADALRPFPPRLSVTSFPWQSLSVRPFTKNQFSLTKSGEVLTLDGTSQLPFLLGNLSLVPFEPLPKENEKSWRSDSSISISNSRNESPFALRPFGPFGMQQVDRMQSASELSSFTISDTKDGVVVVGKKYELTTPETGDRESFHMTGTGTWSFDTSQGCPAGSEMRYELKVKDGNTTTMFPIKLSFSKLSQEQIEAKQAEAKLKQEQAEKMSRERKAAASAPIVGQELKDFLNDLQSGDDQKKHSALIKLSQKELDDPDPELVKVIRNLVQSGGHFVHLADSILQKFDPIHKLNKAYEGNGFVESTGLVVDSKTELFVGQILQARENQNMPWKAAELQQLLPDGKVVVQYRGRLQRSGTVSRSDIQLAPSDVTQPNATKSSKVSASPSTSSPSSSATSATPRTWSDMSGSFKLEASFVGMVEEKVVLKKMDGSEIEVPLSRLSLQDQRHVNQLLEETKKLGNPFDK
jgi:hypothetical protein